MGTILIDLGCRLCTVHPAFLCIPLAAFYAWGYWHLANDEVS
jgi:hypothetical protein